MKRQQWIVLGGPHDGQKLALKGMILSLVQVSIPYVGQKGLEYPQYAVRHAENILEYDPELN